MDMPDAPDPRPFLRQRDVAHSVWYLGPNLYTFLADGAATGGAYALLHVVAPRGQEPPPHTHTREDEVFYLLDGEMEFWVGGEHLVAGPGALVHLPRGIEHRFALRSDTVECLIWLTPAGLEKYFRHPELSRPAAALRLGPPLEDPRLYARAAALFAHFGATLAAPPSQGRVP